MRLGALPCNPYETGKLTSASKLVKPKTTSKTSQTTLAGKLGLSQQRISQLIKAGCPPHSLSAAKAWIAAKSKEAMTAPEAGTLSEGRLRKVLLECRLLQAKIDRELDSSEMMATSQLEAGLEFIIAMFRHSITNGAGELANAAHGLSLQDSYLVIRDAGQNALLNSLEAFVNNSALDARLKRLAARSIADSHYQLPASKAETRREKIRKAVRADRDSH